MSVTTTIQEKAEISLGARDRVAEQYTKDVSTQPTKVHALAAGAFNTLAVAAVTLMVVVFVVGMIEDSMQLSDDNEFANASDTVVSTTGDAFNLAAVALIVLVASVILYYVGNFGGGGSRLR
ncbi:MAG: hypothetical protein ACOCUO_03255 [archaeon]